ncbi:MAG TPA: hypothetical protein VGH73_11195 [Thermoanaerobaculia bacterium]
MIRRALFTATTILAIHLALPGTALSAPAPRPAPPSPVDDELVAMGETIPGFGGMFYDADGYPTVYLRDTRHPAAVAALKSLGSQVRVLQGDYEFAQLVAWKRALRPALGLPGVVYLDADEARNRVVVGVTSLNAASPDKSLDRGRLDKEITARGVPPAAVLYVEAPPLSELIAAQRMGDPAGAADKRKPSTASIQSTIRPVPGAVQLSFIKQPYIYFCTIGFNAYLGGAFGFVTNSHCTSDRGAVDGTRYSQGDPYGAAIATEIADPSYSTGGSCPAGRKCRYSDSAFAQYDGASLGSFGKLSHPATRGVEVGSLTLKPATSRFNVTGAGPAPLSGQVVNKIGRTTGWTYGPVIATCVDVDSSSTEFTLFCQHIVQAGTQGGDSGSPVFSWTSGTAVKLLGILWAGGTDSHGHGIFAFSPFSSIQQELGPLRVN